VAAKDALKREIRSLQTHFPAIRSAKFSAYNWATRTIGWRVEPEFRLLEALAPVSLAIDIGGNWGQSILALQRHARPQNIISFEPNPQLSQRLKRVFADDKTVSVEPRALGDTPGSFNLFVPSYRGFVYDGLASLDYESAASWLNSQRMARFDESKLEIAEHAVEVTTLDSFDLAPDVIKIDVQGHEEAVIDGGIKTIERSKPVIILEDPTDGLIGKLSDVGIEQFGLVNGRLIAGDRSQSNSIFLTPEKRRIIQPS
jgi:FkbM family methyltransferase